jgi:hypothetical protein
MASADNLVVIYKELADAHERQRQPQMRDRFLVLAADAALTAGRPAEADLLLARLLRSNPHHMLRPYATFAEAMASPDVANYVGELRRAYPPEQAEAEFDALRAARGGPPPGRPANALPPTAPVVDLDDLAERAGPGHEPLKVYRTQDEGEAPAAPSLPRVTRPPAPRPPAAPPRSAPRPVPPSPLVTGVGAGAPRPSPPPSPADAEDTAKGSWLSLALFVLVLAAALALAGWALVGPFLPHG